MCNPVKGQDFKQDLRNVHPVRTVFLSPFNFSLSLPLPLSHTQRERESEREREREEEKVHSTQQSVSCDVFFTPSDLIGLIAFSVGDKVYKS